jgi:IBR domain, a half RING-finger domain
MLDSCCHLLCTDCIKGKIKASYPDVVCPVKSCGIKLANAEIRLILGDKEYEDLQTEMTNKLLEEQEGIVRCKCGNAIEFVKGEVMYNYKNDEGKNINKVAARHMSSNRVRCPECGINFCVGCKAEPYHLGLNCQQYEKQKNAKKCRFCGGILKGIK